MRKIISLLFFIVLLISVGFMMSFQQPDSAPLSIDQLIKNAVEKKLNDYRRVRNKKCKSTILEAAATRADSIVISKIKALKVIQDTIYRPIPPDRPLRPELLEPIDSSAPAPLLESGGDTSENKIHPEIHY